MTSKSKTLLVSKLKTLLIRWSIMNPEKLYYKSNYPYQHFSNFRKEKKILLIIQLNIGQEYKKKSYWLMNEFFPSNCFMTNNFFNQNFKSVSRKLYYLMFLRHFIKFIDMYGMLIKSFIKGNMVEQYAKERFLHLPWTK